MATLALLFLIGSLSFLQVTRKCIKAWTTSIFGHIPPLTTELATLLMTLLAGFYVRDRCSLGYLLFLQAKINPILQKAGPSLVSAKWYGGSQTRVW